MRVTRDIYIYTNKLRNERYTTGKDYFLRKIISLAVLSFEKAVDLEFNY